MQANGVGDPLESSADTGLLFLRFYEQFDLLSILANKPAYVSIHISIKHWIVILLLNIFHNVCAQTDSVKINRVDNVISFSLGPNTGFLKDVNYSILNYRQRGMCYNLGYRHQNKEKSFLLNSGISFTSGKLSSDAADHFTTPFVQGQLFISVLFDVYKKDKSPLRTYAGPQLNSFFQYMQWGDNMDSWSYLMAHGLNFSIYQTFRLSSRKSLNVFGTIPVLSNFVRPPYNGFNEHIVQNQEKILKLAFEGEPVTLNKYLSIDLKFVYLYSLGKHVDFSFAYMLRYQHVPGYNELTQWQNQFTAGLNICF